MAFGARLDPGGIPGSESVTERGEGLRRTAAGKLGVVFERFTDRARRVLVLAQEEARLFNHRYIGTEHILLGLIGEGDGVAAQALTSLGVSLEAARKKVEERSAGPPPRSPARRRSPRGRRGSWSCRFERRCSWGIEASTRNTCSWASPVREKARLSKCSPGSAFRSIRSDKDSSPL